MFMFTRKKSFKVRFKEATPAAAAWVHIEEKKKVQKKQGHHFPTSRPPNLNPPNTWNEIKMWLFIVLFIIFIQWSFYTTMIAY